MTRRECKAKRVDAASPSDSADTDRILDSCGQPLSVDGICSFVEDALHHDAQQLVCLGGIGSKVKLLQALTHRLNQVCRVLEMFAFHRDIDKTGRDMLIKLWETAEKDDYSLPRVPLSRLFGQVEQSLCRCNEVCVLVIHAADHARVASVMCDIVLPLLRRTAPRGSFKCVFGMDDLRWRLQLDLWKAETLRCVTKELHTLAPFITEAFSSVPNEVTDDPKDTALQFLLDVQLPELLTISGDGDSDSEEGSESDSVTVSVQVEQKRTTRASRPPRSAAVQIVKTDEELLADNFMNALSNLPLTRQREFLDFICNNAWRGTRRRQTYVIEPALGTNRSLRTIKETLQKSRIEAKSLPDGSLEIPMNR